MLKKHPKRKGFAYFSCRPKEFAPLVDDSVKNAWDSFLFVKPKDGDWTFNTVWRVPEKYTSFNESPKLSAAEMKVVRKLKRVERLDLRKLVDNELLHNAGIIHNLLPGMTSADLSERIQAAAARRKKSLEAAKSRKRPTSSPDPPEQEFPLKRKKMVGRKVPSNKAPGISISECARTEPPAVVASAPRTSKAVRSAKSKDKAPMGTEEVEGAEVEMTGVIPPDQSVAGGSPPGSSPIFRPKWDVTEDDSVLDDQTAINMVSHMVTPKDEVRFKELKYVELYDLMNKSIGQCVTAQMQMIHRLEGSRTKVRDSKAKVKDTMLLLENEQKQVQAARAELGATKAELEEVKAKLLEVEHQKSISEAAMKNDIGSLRSEICSRDDRISSLENEIQQLKVALPIQAVADFKDSPEMDDLLLAPYIVCWRSAAKLCSEHNNSELARLMEEKAAALEPEAEEGEGGDEEGVPNPVSAEIEVGTQEAPNLLSEAVDP